MKYMARWVLVAMMGAAAAACTTTKDEGPTEHAAANAGRVVDDSVITGKVKAELVADPTTKAHQISVETFQGVVQLSGFVSSQAAMDQAVRITRGIEGVSSVRNDMRIK